ncbi:death domain-associated protein 6 [Ambystoma mexicanum]|uniref:death domain-associated protein 6 n=1 Tax=Ambystoma mexicanum TaxID=8296 RepID=UPI0037E72A87
MAKQDGGIIVLDDDDDDGELKTGSAWVARPWKLPSSSSIPPKTVASPPLAGSKTPSSVRAVRSRTPRTTSNDKSQTPPPFISKDQPHTPPSTSKYCPQVNHSTSTCLPTTQTNGSDVMPVPEKEDAKGSLKAINENLFKEFVDFCGSETAEHPEVMSFLQGRYQKTSPAFLASTEFRNVIGRCLNRVQKKKSKVYVYINELCTVLKSNSEKKKVLLSSAPAAGSKHKQPQHPSGVPSGDRLAEERADSHGEESQEAGTDAPAETEDAGQHHPGSRRQIRYLENLLSVYTTEIRRLQEKELDLEQLDDEDSIYIQENRLKRKMIRIFQKLCELKSCCSRTGRVIEQRIPYRGTRYPEVNRRIQKFINKPDNFPDYGDILKVIEKANIRHNLELSKRQMQSMAADAFRDVGNRLQERRHLDMVYNFGSHLTDKYKTGTDPALMDPVLARRLRDNRSVALSHLDEVVKKYAVMQDDGEDELDRKRRRGGSSHYLMRGSKEPEASTSASMNQESEEDEDEDDESSDTDIEEELQKCEGMSDPEDEAVEEEPAPDITESDQRMDNRSEPSQCSSAGEEVEDEDDEDDDDEDEEEEEDEDQDANIKNGEDPKQPEDDSKGFSKPVSPESSEMPDKTTEHKNGPMEDLKEDSLGSRLTADNGELKELEEGTKKVLKPDPMQVENKPINLLKQKRHSIGVNNCRDDSMEDSNKSSGMANHDAMDCGSNPDAGKYSVPAASKSADSVILEYERPVKKAISSEIEPFYEPPSKIDSPPVRATVPSESSVELVSDLRKSSKTPATVNFQTCSSLEMPFSDLESVCQTAGDPVLSTPISLVSSAGTAGSSATCITSEMVHHKPASSPALCEPHSMSSPQPESPGLLLGNAEPLKDSSVEACGSQAASPVPLKTQSSLHLQISGPSVSSSPNHLALPQTEMDLQMASTCLPFSPPSRELNGSPSPTQSPRVLVSPVSFPKPPDSPTTSRAPPDSSSVCAQHPASSNAPPPIASSKSSLYQTASPKPAGFQSASPRPMVCQSVSPRLVSPGLDEASQLNSPRSRTTSPESSQSSSSALESLASSSGCSVSQAGSPASSKSLRRSGSKLKRHISGLAESKVCSRTKSSASSDCSVDPGKDMASSGPHNSHGAGITASQESRLCGDKPHSLGACKVTSAEHKGSLKTSQDKCVLIEQTLPTPAESLQAKNVSLDSKDLHPNPALSTCATRIAVKTENPTAAPLKRKRTLADTVRTLQSKFDTASQENGRKYSMASVNGSRAGSFAQGKHQPKRMRREEGYHNSSVVEVHSINSDSDDDEANLSLNLHVTCVSPHSPAPSVDSTQDSTFLSLVTSSSFSSRQQHKITKINASTQCDPEEVIVLSDSD